MTDTTLDRCAAAIAEVRAKYVSGPVVYNTTGKCRVWVREPYPSTIAKPDKKPVFTGSWEECQTWIDTQAARACVAALLPVSDGMQKAAQSVDMMGPHAAVFPYECTAAINSVLEGKA